jgi:hypothetical protein
MSRRDYIILALALVGMIVSSAGLVWVAFFLKN